MEPLHSRATVVFLSFICVTFVCGSNQRFTYFKRRDDMNNKLYTHGLLKEVQVKGKIGCVTQCEKHKKCNRVLLNRDSSLCRLFDPDADKDQTEEHAGWQCWTDTSLATNPDQQLIPYSSTALISIGVIGAMKKQMYLGCYMDDADRMLDGIPIEHSKMDHEFCIEKCRTYDYKYASVQYGARCYCGNTMDKARYPQKPDGDCNMPCAGNPTQNCGGIYRNTVFLIN